MCLQIESEERIFEVLTKLEKSVAEIKAKVMPYRRWWKLGEALELKNICYKTASNKKHLQPNCGKEDARVAGCKVWSHETIIKWLELTDADLKERGLWVN